MTFADDNRSQFAGEQPTLAIQREQERTPRNTLHNRRRGEAGGGRSFKTVVVRVAAAGTSLLDFAHAGPRTVETMVQRSFTI